MLKIKSSKKTKKRQRFRFFKNKWLNLIFKLALVSFLLISSFIASIYFGLWGKIPSTKDLESLKQSQATEILDTNNDLIGKLYVYDRQSITKDNIPQYLIDALIATEDVRFQSHNGIDNKSLLRVFFKTLLLSDDSSGGGSTITMQLAKNLYGRQDFGHISIVINKFRESIVALRIEDIYSKDEIVTMYLNTVPFPGNTYGIESASEKFFNKHTRDLSIAEAATLIGSLKANSYYNPKINPEHAKSRRNTVIRQMLKYDFISEKHAHVIMNEELTLDYKNYSPNQGLAPYFRAEIKRQLDELLASKDLRKPDGNAYNLYHDGLKVYTTIDNKLQRYAEAAMAKHMKELQKQLEKSYGKSAPWLKGHPVFEAAKKRLPIYKRLKELNFSESAINDSLTSKREIQLFDWDNTQVKEVSTLDSLEHYSKLLNAGMIALDPQNGEVRAYVGGIDYRFFKYDHVTQSKRQVGSTFKPFVYTAALEQGMKPCTYFPVKEVTYTDWKDWTPRNANGLNDSTLNYSLQKALSESVNTIAVKVLHETGINKVIDQTKSMGIESSINKVPSIALGTANIKVIELAKAYTAYVNNGIPASPVFITRIEDKHGNVLVNRNDITNTPSTHKVISNNTRQVMIEFMKSTINTGTASKLRSEYKLNNDIAGKTGTTQDNKDGWFVGIMPKLVTVTWVGNDNQQIGFKSTRLGQGANTALPIFANFLTQVNRDASFNKITRSKFEQPSSTIMASLDCEPTDRDDFLDKLFKREKNKQEFKKERRKKGIFSFLKKRKKKNDIEDGEN